MTPHELDTPESVRVTRASEDLEPHPLRDALQALARAERGVGAPRRVESVVMRAWDDAHTARESRITGGMRWTGAAAALAATVTLVCGVTLYRVAQVVPEPPALPPAPVLSAHRAVERAALDPTESSATPVARPSGPTSRSASGAVAPPHTTMVLVGAPITVGEQVRVVRMRVARDTLLAMGLRSVVSTDDATVDVEMLVGEDGVARGLRAAM